MTQHGYSSSGSDGDEGSGLDLSPGDSAERPDATWAPRKKREGGSSPSSAESPSSGPSGASNGGSKESPGRTRTRLPEVSEVVFGFRLLGELGHGSFARVFLAEQADLARRPVVLKVSSIAGNEPQMLAQLQHTHIVPIHSLHEDAATGLRALCMPYFGGAALSQVLQQLSTDAAPARRGEQLAQALATVAARAPTPETAPGVGPTADKPFPWAGLDYAGAAVWIVARLAEALQHAHDRGMLHRDVKPSNVLMAADGRPMLLDFNISQSAAAARQSRGRPELSGTVGYMSPEHLRALSSRDPALAREVDHRSDIYSLGLILFEMLAGHKPFEQTGSYFAALPLIAAMALERGRRSPSIRGEGVAVPWGLESILRKCLAPNPAQRYQQAEQLAEDCRRFLEDRPLRYAPELSRTERFRKWVRRHPRLTSSSCVAAIAVLLLLTAGGALLGVRGHLAQAQEQLVSSEAKDRKRAFEEGSVRAVCLVNTFTDLRDHLSEGRAVCERTLGLYEVLDRDDWQQGEHWRRLAPEERQALAENVRELLQLLAWARVRMANGSEESLGQALELLNRAESIEGLPPARAVAEDQALYLEKRGDPAAAAMREKARHLPPAGARDHYLLATAYARGGRFEEAVAELDSALRLNPRHYWSVMQRGICYQELGRLTLAAADFGACTGLWPDFAWGYFNRAYALAKSGASREALREYSTALERDPAFLPAWVNRGMLFLEQKQYRAALADFDRAVGLGRDDAFLHVGRGMALEGLKRHPEADDAFAAGLGRLGAAEPETRTRLRLAYGFSISTRRPAEAARAFQSILAQQPNHAQALYGRAMLLVEKGQEGQALALFNRAIAAGEAFVEARRGRAILLARRGDVKGARADVLWCLEREPAAGPTLYAAACVASRTAEQLTDTTAAKQAIEQALDYLRKAFAQGYGRDRAGSDADLGALRGHREFRELLAARPDEDTSKNP